ncbi:MAG: sugar phosphate isomerase/epimerase [Clostridia bacterium]|nr:sugar phosphate isomerase/epimerase [Clostridia bacterium]
MKKMRISSTVNLHGGSRENILKYMSDEVAFQKRMGFDALDLNLGMPDLLAEDWRETVEKIAADAESQGMGFEVCHLPYIMAGAPLEGEAYERFDLRMRRAIEAVKTVGAGYAVMHPNAPTVPLKAFNRAEQYESVMRHLSPYAEQAAKLGVNVVVENMRVIPTFVASHRYCQTPEELCDVADALGIGVCWDFGHANICGIRQSEGLAYVGRRLRVIHVNDNFGIGDDHVPPFIGNVDWKDAMYGLALTGFDGLMNFEIATTRIPEASREALAKYIVDTSKVLMSYIE